MTSRAVESALLIKPIATVISPYREKFGVPRQPGLVPAACGYLEMLPGFAMAEAFEGLDGFSHLWVVFGFHACQGQWRPRVRPPRLGGNREVGVFATRSPYRPNNLGLSVLHFEGLEHSGEAGMRLVVSGLDIVHSTPVYDIKPYVPYADSLPEARGGFAGSSPSEKLDVVFSARARQQLEQQRNSTELAELIVQSLTLDPRPAYHHDKSEGRVYGMCLSDFDVRWRISGSQAVVEGIEPLR